MIVFRKKHFSSEEKEKKDNSGKIGAGLVVGGLAGGTAGNLYFTKGHKVLDNNEIAEKLIREAKDRGFKVRDNGVLPQYSHTALTDEAAKKINKLSRGGLFDTKYIAANKDRADIFAHELGHSRHIDGGVGSKLGKLAHKAYIPSKYLTASPVGFAASLANGIHSGYVSRKKENQGEKESKWNRHKSWALPLAAATPMLVAEFAASRQGLKALKAAGASKELMNMARKKLSAAGGTYLSAAGINAGFGELGRAVGRRIGKKKKKEGEKD